MINFKAGYTLEIKSTRSHGGECGTKLLSGLEANDVEFYMDIARLFKHKCVCANKEFKKDTFNSIKEIITKHPGISRETVVKLGNLTGHCEYNRWKDMLAFLEDNILGNCKVRNSDSICREVTEFNVYVLEQPANFWRVDDFTF